MTVQTNPIEVLCFQRGDDFATIVTDGTKHRSFEMNASISHDSLRKAIAYLESHGFTIMIDKFNGE